MKHEATSVPPCAVPHPDAPDLPENDELDALANTIYRELYKAGYSRDDVVRFANQILGLVRSELREGVPLPLDARKVSRLR